MAAKDLNKKLASNILSVYGYTDYRRYLKDFYEFKKTSTRGYSYRAFSRAAGLGSPNFLKLVVDNQRNLGVDTIPQFIKALGLSSTMAKYFKALVLMNQAKTDEEKEIYFDEIRKLTPASKRRDLNLNEYEYLSHWLGPVIREMVSLGTFKDDPYWICRRLNAKVKLNDVQNVLSFLKNEGFIVREEDGYKAVDNMVFSSDEVCSLAIRNYHRQMLEQAKESLDNLPVSEREFGAIIFALPESSIEELKQKIKKFRDELHEWAVGAVSSEPGDVVLQMNLQMYPHTRKIEENG